MQQIHLSPLKLGMYKIIVLISTLRVFDKALKLQPRVYVLNVRSPR